MGMSAITNLINNITTTSFPIEQIIVIALVRFAEPIAFTSLFPYVYFMVQDFGIAATEADIAKYAGYLSSIFAFAQFLTCYQWGKFADRHGRKPTIMIGLAGSIISLNILGFATSYHWAFFARCFNGMLNGNVAVIRTLIGENIEGSGRKSHQALAFATMPLIWQIGSVIGPMIGGFMSGRDAVRSIELLAPLREKYPYALPNICISLLLGTSMIIALFFLEETHYQHKYRRDYFIEAADFLKANVFGMKYRQRPWLAVRLIASPSSTSLSGECSTKIQSTSEESEETPLLAGDAESSLSSFSKESDHESSWDVLTKPHIFYGVICNFLIAWHLTINDEFLPIYLAYDVARNNATGELTSHFPLHIQGGLGYTSRETGQLLSMTGIFGIFVLLVVFPYVNHHYNSLSIYKSMILIFPICYTLTPYFTLLANHRTASMIAAYFLTSIKTMAVSISLPQIIILIHNSSPAKQIGMINGAIISISALARTVGPLVWGYVFAYSETHAIGWVSWWSLTVLALIACYMGKFLRNSNTTELN